MDLNKTAWNKSKNKNIRNGRKKKKASNNKAAQNRLWERKILKAGRKNLDEIYEKLKKIKKLNKPSQAAVFPLTWATKAVFIALWAHTFTNQCELDSQEKN